MQLASNHAFPYALVSPGMLCQVLVICAQQEARPVRYAVHHINRACTTIRVQVVCCLAASRLSSLQSASQLFLHLPALALRFLGRLHKLAGCQAAFVRIGSLLLLT